MRYESTRFLPDDWLSVMVLALQSSLFFGKPNVLDTAGSHGVSVGAVLAIIYWMEAVIEGPSIF